MSTLHVTNFLGASFGREIRAPFSYYDSRKTYARIYDKSFTLSPFLEMFLEKFMFPFGAQMESIVRENRGYTIRNVKREETGENNFEYALRGLGFDAEVVREFRLMGIQFIIQKYFEGVEAPHEGDFVVYYDGIKAVQGAILHMRGDGTWEVESKWTMGGRENPYVFHHDLFLVPFYYGKRAHVYRLKKNWKLAGFPLPPKHGGSPMAVQVDGSFRFVPTGENNAIQEELTRESKTRKILDRFPQIQHIETAYDGICSQYAFAKTLPGHVLSFTDLDDLLSANPSQILAKYFTQVSDPEPGDLAVYSEGGGRRVHMGVYVAPDLVESKWGPFLGVFRHPFFYVDRSYGDTITFYRPNPGASL